MQNHAFFTQKSANCVAEHQKPRGSVVTACGQKNNITHSTVLRILKKKRYVIPKKREVFYIFTLTGMDARVT
jgi:hypothetical protein